MLAKDWVNRLYSGTAMAIAGQELEHGIFLHFNGEEVQKPYRVFGAGPWRDMVS